jgi:acetyl-CoA C-acetyltransferase
LAVPASGDRCLALSGGSVGRHDFRLGLQAGAGQITARQAAVAGGLPMTIPALTINKVCLSGVNAIYLADQMIQAGDAEIVVAGGMESMSNCPYLLPKARQGMRLGHAETVDSMILDGLWDAYDDSHMGCTGEIVAERYGVTRKEQDGYAVESHRKAIAAIQGGAFDDEILAVPIPEKKDDPVLFAADESPREDTSLEALGKLRPAFKENGTVTAGNAPGVNDGAAALVVASAEKARALGLRPLARIVAQAVAGLEPSLVMMTPVPAVKKLLAKTRWSVDSIDLIELNEAFAVQAIAVTRERGLDPAKVNVNGGAVALGHPIGASGARILTTLLYALKQRGLRRGIATLCLGGGNGVALAIERVEA